jgi:hypothetical protein
MTLPDCGVDQQDLFYDDVEDCTYNQPSKITRSEDSPLLSDLTGTIVIKISWPGIDRRHSEANMLRDSRGRFGTIPHVCSYEATDENGEPISNVLFLPPEDKIEEYHWDIFGRSCPAFLDVRVKAKAVFDSEGKSLTEAKGPRDLSRAWAHFTLGTFVFATLHRPAVD